MDEPTSQAGKTQKERRYDPELLKKGLRCDLDQYEMLKCCSNDKDTIEWNTWREQHPNEDVFLEGADFSGFYLNNVYLHTGPFGCPNIFRGKIHLTGAKFDKAELEEAQLNFAHLDKSVFTRAKLKKARFDRASLKGAFFFEANLREGTLADGMLRKAEFNDSDLTHANFNGSDLRGAEFAGCRLHSTQFRAVLIDGATQLWACKVNRPCAGAGGTDFTGAAFGSCRIEPSTRQLLEYNVRRMNWEAWYKYKKWQVSEDERHTVVQKLMWFVRKFWEISDYGLSTKRIIWTFFKWAILFAAVYYIWGFVDYYFVGIKDHPGIVTDLFVLADGQEAVSPWLVPFRAVYFSIVTMTTLGFGDMYANAHGFLRGFFGHTLLAFQVILGYVLMGALVTRFAVLFTAGGPAGRFADEKKGDDGK